MNNLDFIQINSDDNVAISLNEKYGIQIGHKVALKNISRGDPIIKYGNVIGIASIDIAKGEWVHNHNMSSHFNAKSDYNYYPNHVKTKAVSPLTFMGYKRKCGRAGVRNNIYIISTVGCVNSIVKSIESRANKLDLGTIDGVIAITHQFGCSQLGEDQKNITKLLVSLAINPNASYVLFVGLGCESNNINTIKKALEPYHRDNISFYNAQDVDDEIDAGFDIVRSMVAKARNLKRSPISVSELCIGLKCGASDAFSGVTANPTVGRVSDRIIAMGGSTILTEVPEMFGAEQILMNKCSSRDIYLKFKDMIEGFKQSYIDAGVSLYNEPSSANKAGGVTTLEEKSLGCITKAGTSKIIDVIEYCEPCLKSGLNVLDGPGNDLVAITSLAASGCQLILFTTGRGTPLSTIIPTIKISSNKQIEELKGHWIDFCAFNMDDDVLFDLLIKTASGEYKTKQENSHEIGFYKKGVTL